MATENRAEPTGTGQEGAGSPAGVNAEIPIHIEGSTHEEPSRVDRAADRAAHKGLDRQHHDDATIFTK